MTYTTSTARAASRANPFDAHRRRRAEFARQAVIAEFGWRFGKALDQDNFVDVSPNWRRLGPVVEAVTKTLDRHRRSAEHEFRAPKTLTTTQQEHTS